jgi:Multiubiquitin
MADEVEQYGVILNLDAKVVPQLTVTFDGITRLAFPHKADDPNITFTVTYLRAETPAHQGVMVEGDTVGIKKDGATSFTVVHATKSIVLTSNN